MDPSNPLMYQIIGVIVFSVLIVFIGGFLWRQLQRVKERDAESSSQRSISVDSLDHRTKQTKTVGSSVYLRVPLGPPEPGWHQATVATIEGIAADGTVKLRVHETRGNTMRDVTYTASPKDLSHDPVPIRA